MSLTILQDGSERIRYENPSFPIYVSRGDLLSFPNMSALCHWHEELEILMPIKGYLRYNINGTTVTVQEGNAIFVNTRQLHYGFSDDGSDCEYLCVAFLPELLYTNEDIRNRFVVPLLTSHSISHLILRRTIPEHRPLLSAIARMGSLTEEHIRGYEMHLMAKLYVLWQGLYMLLEDRIGEEVSTDSNMLIQKRMLDFVRTHYAEKLSVDAIAASGGVCRTKCWQIFRKYLGQTPNEYLNSYRLEKGMQLLKSSRMSVTEIAQECGFSSASYFTELFTRQKGCSPTQYRRR